jgi:hypothetical protein
MVGATAWPSFARFAPHPLAHCAMVKCFSQGPKSAKVQGLITSPQKRQYRLAQSSPRIVIHHSMPPIET